jgi:RNA polymerase sigma factor (sigma-70 family)
MELTMNRTRRPRATAAAPPSADGWRGSDAVYASTYRDLLRVAYVLTGSAPAAEDVVHDVFASVGPRFADLDDPLPYLRVAVVNRCRSLHRRVLAAPQPQRRDDAVLDVGLTELRDALAELSVKQRTAIVLRYLCDLPDQEIADILDCRRATVRSLVQRGLAELRTALDDTRDDTRDARHGRKDV